MKKLIIAMSLTMAATMSFGQLKKPFTKGGFETGKYRNVFLEAGYSQKEIDKKVDEVFNEVFFSKDKHVYFEVNDTMAYIKSVCSQLGVPSVFVPDVEDRDTMCAFAAAISRHENGEDADMKEVQDGWELL